MENIILNHPEFKEIEVVYYFVNHFLFINNIALKNNVLVTEYDVSDTIRKWIRKQIKTQKAIELWDILGDTCVNDVEEIDEKFLDFEKGTDIYEIWHWFEETFDISVAEDLMFIKK